MTQLAFLDSETGLPVLVKQPGESRVFRFDFSNKLRNDVLATLVAASAMSQGKVAGSTAVAISGEAVSGRFATLTLAGGTDNENYKVSIQVITSNGQLLEGDGMLYVREY